MKSRLLKILPFFLAISVWHCATTRPFDTTSMDIWLSEADVIKQFGKPDYTAAVLTPEGRKLKRFEFRHANWNRTIYDPAYEILHVLFFDGKVVAWGRPEEISLREADIVIEKRFR